jgi:hypothetical protein
MPGARRIAGVVTGVYKASFSADREGADGHRTDFDDPEARRYPA